MPLPQVVVFRVLLAGRSMLLIYMIFWCGGDGKNVLLKGSLKECCLFESARKAGELSMRLMLLSLSLFGRF